MKSLLWGAFTMLNNKQLLRGNYKTFNSHLTSSICNNDKNIIVLFCCWLLLIIMNNNNKITIHLFIYFTVRLTVLQKLTFS